MENSSSSKMSIVKSLSWIVGSTLLISGSGHAFFSYIFSKNKDDNSKEIPVITAIIQTGPQKEALRSEYLAELIGLSKDVPTKTKDFDPKKSRKDLLQSPLIQDATVKIIKPSTVYIDFTVRQPIAIVYDYENVAIDKEGYLIPMYPFFPPKNLPELFLGLGPFEHESAVSYIPQAKWNTALKGELVDIFYDILNRIQPYTKDLFRIKRIDVSKAREKSLGRREIVVILENEVFLSSMNEAVIFTHYLRLSTKNYPQELGNYLELRKKMLDVDLAKLQNQEITQLRFVQEKIIDLRISQLAFIDERKKHE